MQHGTCVRVTDEQTDGQMRLKSSGRFLALWAKGRLNSLLHQTDNATATTVKALKIVSLPVEADYWKTD
jgi:hypothetical protein